MQAGGQRFDSVYLHQPERAKKKDQFFENYTMYNGKFFWNEKEGKTISNRAN